MRFLNSSGKKRLSPAFTPEIFALCSPSSLLLSSKPPFRVFTFQAFTKSACSAVKWGKAPLPFLRPPVALQHEREGWGLEVAVTSFLVCATCSKFATKCLSSVELTGGEVGAQWTMAGLPWNDRNHWHTFQTALRYPIKVPHPHFKTDKKESALIDRD